MLPRMASAFPTFRPSLLSQSDRSRPISSVMRNADTSRRHHWWPSCHSSLWVDESGLVTAVRQDGSSFATTPKNLAVRRDYNSIPREDGSLDDSLEQLLANRVEGRIGKALTQFQFEPSKILPGTGGMDLDSLRKNRRQLCEQGFRIREEFRYLPIEKPDLEAIALYIASMTVRIPSYKDQLNSNHVVLSLAKTLGICDASARNVADQMHVRFVSNHMNEIKSSIQSHKWVIVETDCGIDNFLFGDSPVITSEYTGGDADLFFPLTPNRAIIGMPGYFDPWNRGTPLFRVGNNIVRFYNRCQVMNANEFVFCRGNPPISFIKRRFGSRTIRLSVKISES